MANEISIDAYLWEQNAPLEAEFADLGHLPSVYAKDEYEMVNENEIPEFVSDCIGHNKLYIGSNVVQRGH